MSGPRVTSGTDSKQDYQTQAEFIAAIVKRYGPISFDLAAHAGNKQHARYFAPTHFTRTIETKEAIPAEQRGELRDGVWLNFLKYDKKKDLYIYEERTRNDDPEAYGKDAFAHGWADLSKKFGGEHPSGRALLWLNCEFNDAARWAERCLYAGQRGANIVLLTPMTTSNWYRDFIAGRADVDELSGRISFDGKNAFPKDCMVSHFSPDMRGRRAFWDWNDDRVITSWNKNGAPL